MISAVLGFIWTSPVLMCALFTLLFFFMITMYLTAPNKNSKKKNKLKKTDYMYTKVFIASLAAALLIKLWWSDSKIVSN
jgi:hypothetical protein